MRSPPGLALTIWHAPPPRFCAAARKGNLLLKTQEMWTATSPVQKPARVGAVGSKFARGYHYLASAASPVLPRRVQGKPASQGPEDRLDPRRSKKRQPTAKWALSSPGAITIWRAPPTRFCRAAWKGHLPARRRGSPGSSAVQKPARACEIGLALSGRGPNALRSPKANGC